MNISGIFSNFNIASITPLVIPIIKMGIDSLNLRTAEKVFFSPSKRFTIFLSQVLLIDIFVFSIFFAAYVFFDQGFEESFIYKLAIFTIMLSIFIYTVVFSVVNLLSLKFKFSFKDENNNTWEIEKRISKQKMLVSKNNNIFKHFDVNEVMDKELNRNLDKRFFLPYHKKLIDRLPIIISILIFLIIISEYLMIKENTFSIFAGSIIGLISLFGFIYVICVKNNEKLINHYPDNSTTSQSKSCKP